VELDEPCPVCDEVLTFEVTQRNIKCTACKSQLRHSIAHGTHELIVTRRSRNERESE
jgi:hypothetical protein